jgi:hypothetical protein
MFHSCCNHVPKSSPPQAVPAMIFMRCSCGRR